MSLCRRRAWPDTRLSACPPVRPPAGFTLIELLVALTIGATVLLMAHRMIATVVDAVGTIEAAQRANDREANGRRLLIQLLGNIDLQVGDGMAFAGMPHRLSFPSWVEDPSGWPSRGQSRLAVEDGWLVAEVPASGKVRLWRDVEELDADYLLARGASEEWVPSWVSEASLPEAVRLRVRRRSGAADTLLLVIGARG